MFWLRLLRGSVKAGGVLWGAFVKVNDLRYQGTKVPRTVKQLYAREK